MSDPITLHCSVCDYSRTFDYGSTENNLDAICDEGWELSTYEDSPRKDVQFATCVNCRADHRLPY